MNENIWAVTSGPISYREYIDDWVADMYDVYDFAYVHNAPNASAAKWCAYKFWGSNGYKTYFGKTWPQEVRDNGWHPLHKVRAVKMDSSYFVCDVCVLKDFESEFICYCDDLGGPLENFWEEGNSVRYGK